MREYVDRLIRCGFAPHDAFSTCNRLIRDYGEAELEVFVSSIESTAFGVPYVD